MVQVTFWVLTNLKARVRQGFHDCVLWAVVIFAEPRAVVQCGLGIHILTKQAARASEGRKRQQTDEHCCKIHYSLGDMKLAQWHCRRLFHGRCDHGVDMRAPAVRLRAGERSVYQQPALQQNHKYCCLQTFLAGARERWSQQGSESITAGIPSMGRMSPAQDYHQRRMSGTAAERITPFEGLQHGSPARACKT